nr:reverse transcriptase domain-containing protein [Tanacetum cinerariifolium]
MTITLYFPPSMETKLRNEITNFRQCPDESLFEAWERYKLSVDRFPNDNMLPVTQIDTFYNGLTLRHHDTINAATSGTFMKRRPEECYDLIKNMIAHHNYWDTSAQPSESSSSITSSFDSEIIALKAKMAEINKNLIRILQINHQVKAVTPNCETCGGLNLYYDCPATISQTQNVYAAGAYQGAITFNLDQTSRYSANYNDMAANQIDVIVMAYEEYSKEFLNFSDMIMNGNPTPYYDLIVSTSSPTLTPFGDSDFLLEEVDAFLALEDDSTSPKVDHSYYDPEGDILLLEAFLNDDPSLPPPNQGMYLPQVQKELKICEAKNDKSSLMSVPSPWVSPVHCVPKKGGYTVVENEENKLILTRLVTGWRICIEYRKLNEATRKDHFPLSFMDQMLERLAGNEYYCFLDVFRNSFETCLPHLEKMLKRCKDTNLCLNWEKSHFMVKEGIVLGHKISNNGIEVDKAKVDVISKLPYPTTVKVYTDHSALKYLFNKQDAKPRLLRWVLLLQEFNITVRDKKGAENLATDHLSRLENPHQSVLDKKEINETFLLETLNMFSFRDDSSTQ